LIEVLFIPIAAKITVKYRAVWSSDSL